MEKIEHIGIAVRDLRISSKLYAQLLGCSSYKTEEVISEHVMTEFFQVGESKIELLQATSDQSVIHSFLEKKGEGVHHIAFSVIDIRKEMARLKREGFVLLNEEPKPGADNKLVCFLHPKTTGGVLIELCQEIER